MTAADFLRRLVQAKRSSGPLVLDIADAKAILEDAQRSDLLWGGSRRQRAASLFGIKEGATMITSLRLAVTSGVSTFDGTAIQVRA